MNTAAGGPARNWLGGAGAWAADALLWSIGPAVALLLPLMLVAARRLWQGRPIEGWRGRLVAALFGIAIIDSGATLIQPTVVDGLPAGIGGAMGFVGAGAIGWFTGFAEGFAPVNWINLGIGIILALVGIIVWSRASGSIRMKRPGSSASPRCADC